MSGTLQRVSLNLAPETRLRLRALAKAAGKPEAEVGRELLVDAIERASSEVKRVRSRRSTAFE